MMQWVREFRGPLTLPGQPVQYVPVILCSIVISLERAPVSCWEVTTRWLDPIFAPVVKERPICVMARAVLERLLDAPRIEARFARIAPQPYTRELMFSSLVQWRREVVRGGHPTVHAAYQANNAALGVSPTAWYHKLDRVETGVSAALVRDSAALAEPVVQAWRARHPRWLPG